MGLLSINMPMVLSRSLSVSSGADSWLLLAGAIVPPVILLVYIYMRDPHEKEPIGLLAKLFFLGVLSCIPAALFEYLGQDIILKESGIKEVHLYFFILCFLIIALAEEGFKYIMLYLGSWKSKYFNYRFDGIVYSVFVSLGFATIENVMYVFNSTGGMSTAIARALLSIPGHCTFGIYMGYYYGQAKYREAVGDIQGSRSQRRTGIITAIILHGIYDFCLMVSSAAREYIFIGVFFIFIIVLDILALSRVRRSSKQEVPHNYMHESNLIGSYMQQPYQQFGQQYGQQYGYNNPYVQGGQYNTYQNAPNGYGTYQPQNSYGQTQTYSSTTYAQPQQAANPIPPAGKVFCTCCGAACRPNAFYCSSCGKPLMR